MNTPVAFLSYSSEDKIVATKIANYLRSNGIDVWFDSWEIKAGDSLVSKIFKEGLSKCSFFIVLISNNSINSKWVKEELNKAFIKRIEGTTKIIPLRIENCKVPTEISDLRWIDISEKNLEEGLREVLKTIYDVTDKPPLGTPPTFIVDRLKSVAGYSPEATNICLYILSKNDDNNAYTYIDAQEISKDTGLTPKEINIAVDELEDSGLVKLHKSLGTFPYEFSGLSPTYVLFFNFAKDVLHYDPEKDVKQIAVLISNKNELDGPAITKETDLTPGRINRAVEYLEDSGIVKVLKTLGTSPYSFYLVYSTSATHRFVKNI